ncbi:hypothetical protein [Virgibacillus ndiopensis]|uniref:hypothetical protein n=1 Tax=Virgibacillus ndiopensis TaxID=2004408 RepID=UPI00159B9A72|nr:hypothetical protein [Virgibacillus ndiopensis]
MTNLFIKCSSTQIVEVNRINGSVNTNYAYRDFTSVTGNEMKVTSKSRQKPRKED